VVSSSLVENKIVPAAAPDVLVKFECIGRWRRSASCTRVELSKRADSRDTKGGSSMQPMYYIGLDNAQENKACRANATAHVLHTVLDCHTGLTFPCRSVDEKRCHNRGTQR